MNSSLDMQTYEGTARYIREEEVWMRYTLTLLQDNRIDYANLQQQL